MQTKQSSTTVSTRRVIADEEYRRLHEAFIAFEQELSNPDGTTLQANTLVASLEAVRQLRFMTANEPDAGAAQYAKVLLDDKIYRAALKEINKTRRLFDENRGTALSPDEVIRGLRALAEHRLAIVPVVSGRTVYSEHDDWSNPDEVPLSALGLGIDNYRALHSRGIKTVGLLAKHSRRGLRCTINFTQGSTRVFGSRRLDGIEARLKDHGLQFASDNLEIPLSLLMIDRRAVMEKRTFDLDYESLLAFFEERKIITLGDLQGITVRKLHKWSPKIRYSSHLNPAKPILDLRQQDDLWELLNWLNGILRHYGLKEIAYSVR